MILLSAFVALYPALRITEVNNVIHLFLEKSKIMLVSISSLSCLPVFRDGYDAQMRLLVTGYTYRYKYPCGTTARMKAHSA